MNIAKNTLIDNNACDAQRAIRAVYSGEPCPNREGQTLLAIGRKGEVRWLVDPRAKKTADSVWKSWIPYSRKARIAWVVLRCSLRIGAIRLMPGVSSVEIPPNRFGQWIERTPEFKGCAPVIFIGKPSVTQKLTVFLGNEQGEVLAVTKIPLTENAVASIENESNALRQLQNVVPGIPRLISPPLADGICIEQWVEGKSTERRLTEKHLLLLLALPRKASNVLLQDKFDALVRRLNPEHRRIAQHFISGNGDKGWNGELREVWEHGDFTPWNLKESPEGHLIPIDWEYASQDGLPLLDLLHFFYRQEYLFRDTGDVRRAIEENEYVKEYCRIFRLSLEMQRDLARYYLVRSLLYDIPALGPRDTYELFVATQLECIE